MVTKHEHDLINAIRHSAHPLTGETTDFDPLLKIIGDSRFVLIGEASHGTHEFYRLRAQITKRLIAEKGFTAVAVEADGRTRIALINLFGLRVETKKRSMPLQASEDSLHGCGAMLTFSILSVGCAITMSTGIPSGLVSTGWTSTACMPRCGQY